MAISCLFEYLRKAKDVIRVHHIAPAAVNPARFKGSVSVTGFTESAALICSDPRYVWGFHGLVDLTAVSVTISLPDIATLVAHTLTKRKHGFGRWAVLVNAPTSTAFAMLFQRGTAGEHPFSIFSTFDAASEFLGCSIDLPLFEDSLAGDV